MSARVSVGGSVLDASGIAIATTTKGEQYPSVAFDGTDYRVVWEDHPVNTGNYDIYGSQVSPAGAVLDPDGVALASALTHYPDVCKGVIGQVLVVYQSYAGDPYNCYHVESTLWPTYAGVEKEEVPAASRLYQSYPNPFNAHCTIRYDISISGRTSLKVFDVSGAVVRTLLDGWREPGGYSEVWDGCDDTGKQLSSGVYMLRLEAGNFTVVRKVVMLK